MIARKGETPAALNCQDAFQQIARRYLASVRRNRAAAWRGDPDAVHRIRIALTQLRAARQFFAAMTRDAIWPRLKAEIRWLNRVLGAVRDSDVTTAHASTVQDGLFAADRARLAGLAARRHRQLATALRSPRCDRLLAGLARWIDEGPWLSIKTADAIRRRSQPLAGFAPARLHRWRRRLVRKSAHGLGSGRRRHRLRIAAKRYRYMHEALTAMGMPEDRAERRNREAARLAQRVLGELRDLDRLRKWRPASVAAKSYRRQKKRLLRQATDAFDELG